MPEKTPCDVHEERLSQLEKREDKQDEMLEKLKNRLPNWATALIGILMAACGWLAAGGSK